MKDLLDKLLHQFLMIYHSMILTSKSKFFLIEIQNFFSLIRYYKPAINGQTKCTITAQHDSVYIAGWKEFISLLKEKN